MSGLSNGVEQEVLMGSLKEWLARLGKKLYVHEVRYIYLPPEEMPAGAGLPDERFEMVRVDASNGDIIDSWDGIKPEFRREFKEMLAAGEVGFFLLDGNTVASHVWVIINHGPDVINRGYLRVYPGEAYAHYAHTYPAYRRQNLARTLAIQMLRLRKELKKEGIYTLKASVLVTNKPSLALLRSVGGRIMGKSYQWRILGFNFYRIRLNEAGREMSEVRW